jgi:hypothetical protein
LEFKPQHHQAVNTAGAISLMRVEKIMYIFLVKLQSFLFLTESKQILVLCHGASD